MVSYVEIDKIAQVLKILFVMINLKTKTLMAFFNLTGTKAEMFYQIQNIWQISITEFMYLLFAII